MVVQRAGRATLQRQGRFLLGKLEEGLPPDGRGVPPQPLSLLRRPYLELSIEHGHADHPGTPGGEEGPELRNDGVLDHDGRLHRRGGGRVGRDREDGRVEQRSRGDLDRGYGVPVVGPDLALGEGSVVDADESNRTREKAFSITTTYLYVICRRSEICSFCS